MKTKDSLRALCVTGLAAGVLYLSAGTPVLAQTAITPAGNGRFYVELKDATLADALEMVFKAAGNPSHLIDESAKQVKVASISFNNVAWDSIVRQLANQNGFAVRKNTTGTTLVESRTPAATGGAGGGAAPAAPTRTVPANPFGAALDEGDTNVTTVANAQFNRGGTNRNTTTGNNGTTNGNGRGNRRQLSPDGDYKLLIVKHIYAGAIANVFAEGEIIATEDMVLPASAGSGIGSSGGGGGFGGGGGGFGGGGFGGGNTGGGGFGGGGFGGGGGGFGGGGNTGGGLFSDRNLKENVDAVDSRAILERVKDLPIASWNYKAQDASVRHIGPMAQDFAAAFGVGEDNRRINAVDANGVTLASIQALYQMVQEQSSQIKTLQSELQQLKTENQVLRQTATANDPALKAAPTQ